MARWEISGSRLARWQMSRGGLARWEICPQAATGYIASFFYGGGGRHLTPR